MAMHGIPVPSNPYNPSVTVAPHHSHHHHSPAFDAPPTIRYPSPFIPIRLPIFAPVLWINDRIVRVLSVGDNKRGAFNTTTIASEKRRRFSDSTVESVEEGTGDAASSRAHKAQVAPIGLPLRSTNASLRVGGRRKAD